MYYLKVIKSICPCCGSECEKVIQLFYNSEEKLKKNKFNSESVIGVSCHNCEFYQEAVPYEETQAKLI